MDEDMVGNGEAQGRIGNVGVEVEEAGLGNVGSWRDGAMMRGEGGFWDGEVEEDEGDEEIGGGRRGWRKMRRR